MEKSRLQQSIEEDIKQEQFYVNIALHVVLAIFIMIAVGFIVVSAFILTAPKYAWIGIWAVFIGVPTWYISVGVAALEKMQIEEEELIAEAEEIGDATEAVKLHHRRKNNSF